MKRFTAIAALMALVYSPSLHAQNSAQGEAVKALKKMGWVVAIDEKKPGKSVTAVVPGFDRKKVTKDGLVYFKILLCPVLNLASLPRNNIVQRWS